MTKNIIVIGSGFGGIAAALRAKSKGYDVTLVEKHADLGGRARVFKRNKFIYDGGPTVITAPYLIYELFDLFGKDYKKYIEIKPLPIWYRFVFEDNTHFDYSDNEERMQKQIEQINKDDYVGYKKLLKFTEKIFEKGFPSSGIISITLILYSDLRNSHKAIYLVLLFCWTFSKIKFANSSNFGK